MAIGWKIELGGHASRQRDVVERLKTDLSELEVFVREVLQNSIDAWNRAGGDDFVSVRFRLRELTGDDKRRFLVAMDAGEYREQARLSHDYERRLAEASGGNRQNDPAIDMDALSALDAGDPATPLRLLYVEDHGTTGLIGDELDLEAVSKFCACCRDAEFSVKSLRESGGSYGKGKNVLWRHARSRLVLFHSRLSEPYKGERSRFIGVGKLPWHAERGDAEVAKRYTGRCDLGLLDAAHPGRDGYSLLGRHADELAASLGLLPREGDDNGTSICVVGFSPLSDDWDSSLASRITRIAETYYWPAVLEGKVSISVLDERDGTEIQVEPDRREELQPYIRAYQHAVGSDQEHTRCHTLRVPAQPSRRSEVEGRFTIGCERLDVPSEKGAQPESDHVALVRGFGMVVNYLKVSPQRISASNYAGVCLTGFLDPSANRRREGAEGMEALLAFSEPEAHDKWDPKAFSGTQWRGAQKAVREVLDKVKQSITELASGDTQADEGAMMPELSRRFRLTGGLDPRERSLSISQSSPARVKDDGGVTYEVMIDQLRDRGDGLRSMKLRLRALLLDAISGTTLTSESIEIESVLIDGQPLSVETKRGITTASIDISRYPLPLRLNVHARSPGASLRDRAHFGLKVSCNVAGEGNTDA